MKKVAWMLVLAIALLVSGCANSGINDSEQNNASSLAVKSELNEYITSVKERADSIRNALEQDALTQTDMNAKSQELYSVCLEMLA